MPYIEPGKRKQIDDCVEQLSMCINNKGDMNYAITRLIHEEIQQRGICYSLLNGLIGILECCKLELYRMIAAPYENKKRMENGPVSDLDAKSLEDVR